MPTKRNQKQQKPKPKAKNSKRSPLPRPRIPDRIINTSRKEATPWNRQTKALNSLIVGIEDRFHASLLANVFDPSLPFPLPGPNTDPYSSSLGNAGATTLALGNVVSNTNGDPFVNQENRGSTFPNYTAGGSGIGRYARFSGKSISTLETVTDANGALEIWFCHDPFNIDTPVIAFVPATDGNYTGMVRLQSLAWTSNPYPFERNFYPEAGNSPGLDIDNLNLYYEGGSMLHVHTINKNAYLTVSYQTRTGDNTQDRFVDQVNELWSTADPVSPLTLTDTPTMARGAISMYTGTTWSMGTRMSSAISDEDGSKYAYSEYFRRTWALGAPWIRALVRTTAPSAVSAPVQFSISLLSWNATAPKHASTSASMPFETIPLSCPTWMRPLRTRGSVYNGNDSVTTNIWKRQLRTIETSMIPTTPMTRALVSNPTVLPKVISHSTGDSSSSNKPHHWYDTLSSIANTATSVLPWLMNIGKAARSAGPVVTEIAELAPLLLM
jgi:hypothetical protein